MQYERAQEIVIKSPLPRRRRLFPLQVADEMVARDSQLARVECDLDSAKARALAAEKAAEEKLADLKAEHGKKRANLKAELGELRVNFARELAEARALGASELGSALEAESGGRRGRS